MFSPKGYTPFSVLWRRIINSDKFEEIEEYYLGRLRTISKLCVMRVDDQILFWLKRFIGDEIYACFPDGRLFRMDPGLLREAFYSDLVSDVWEEVTPINFDDGTMAKFNIATPIPKEEIDEFEGLVGDYDLAADNAKEEISSQLRNLISKSGEGNGQAQPLLFVAVTTGQIDLTLYRAIVGQVDLEQFPGKLSGEAVNMLGVARIFECASLCVPDSHILQNWNDFWDSIIEIDQRERAEILGSDGYEHVQASGDNKERRRGRKGYKKARDYFETELSGTRGNLSLEQVSRLLERETGERPNVRTLRDWESSSLSGKKRGE